MTTQSRPTRLGRYAPLAALLVAFLLLTGLHNAFTPILEAPDENWHYAYVRWVANGHGLPPLTTDRSGAYQEAVQPPLYYLTAALVARSFTDGDVPTDLWHNPGFGYQAPGTVPDNKNMLVHPGEELWPWEGPVLALHVTRLASTFFGLWTVVAAYALGAEAFARRRWALVTAAFVAFHPQFVLLSSVVNNDAAAAALATTALWLAARVIRCGVGWRGGAVAGLVTGLAVLTKTSVLLTVPLMAAALTLGVLRRQRPPTQGARASEPGILRPHHLASIAVTLGTFAILTLSVAGWWYLRNLREVGDPLALGHHTRTLWSRERPVSLLALIPEAPALLRSFWAAYGWGHVTWPTAVYVLLWALALVPLAVALYTIARQFSPLRGELEGGLRREPSPRPQPPPLHSPQRGETQPSGEPTQPARRFSPLRGEPEGGPRREPSPPPQRPPLHLPQRGETRPPEFSPLRGELEGGPREGSSPPPQPPPLYSPQRGERRPPDSEATTGLLALIWLAAIAAALLRWMQQVEAPHGRLLFPAIGAWALLLAIGSHRLARIRRGRWQRTLIRRLPTLLLLLCATLAALAPGARILATFAPPRLSSTADIAASCAQPVDIRYGDGARLLCAAVEPARAEPGDTVTVSACWTATAPVEANYSVYVHLLGPDEMRVGERHTYPGLGRFPTSLWPAGEAFCDTYRVEIAEWAETPIRYLVAVGLFDTVGFRGAETPIRVPAYAPEGQPLEPPIIGAVAVTARPPEAAAPADTATAAFADPNAPSEDGATIRLRTYTVPETAQVGATLPVTLTWEAITAPPGDYSVFVHLWRPGDPEPLTQHDGRPRDGWYPTASWAAGDLVPDTHVLELPPDLPAGRYPLWAGLYRLEDGVRLAAFGPDGRYPNDMVPLGELRLE